MTEMSLPRKWLTDKSTIGELSCGARRCYTLEDRLRAPGVWVPKATCIPAGRYRVIVDRSNRFSAKASTKAGHPVDVFLPLLLAVPGHEGIRMHGGNDADDVEGCIIVARHREEERVWECAEVLAELISYIRSQPECWITITDEPETDSRI